MQNFSAAADLCSELSKDGESTDDEVIRHVVDCLKSSGAKEFMVSNLFEYLTSSDHDELIRKYPIFGDCTRELLEHNFPSVVARCLVLRQGSEILSDDQFQELVDLMRLPKNDHRLARLEKLRQTVFVDLPDLFQSEYVHLATLVGSLLRKIDEYLRKYKFKTRDGFHSCYTAIVQGSMSGKSRRVRETLKFVFGFYINLMVGGDGFPGRDTKIADWLTKNLPAKAEKDKQRTSRAAHAFYLGCMTTLKDWLGQNGHHNDVTCAIDAWNNFRAEATFWDTVLEKISLQLSAMKDMDIPGHVEYFDTKCKDVLKALNDFYRQKGLPQISPTLLKLLFVFDESRQLAERPDGWIYSAFERLRFPLKNCLRSEPFLFALFSDTVSRIANFLPANFKTSSTKIEDQDINKLFPPIWYMPTIDVWPECDDENYKLSEIVHPAFFTIFGRAAFSVHLRRRKIGANQPGNTRITQINPEDEEFTEQLLLLLLSKMESVPQGTAPTEQHQHTLSSAIAALSSMVVLTTNPKSVLAHNLLASRMQLCCGISECRAHVFLRSAAEPTLSLAARKYAEAYTWNHLFQQLAGAVIAHDVSIGANGETLAQILMILAFDKVTKSSTLFSTFLRRKIKRELAILPITLLQFLETLLGSESFKHININGYDAPPAISPKVKGQHRTNKLVTALTPLTTLLSSCFIRTASFTRYEQEPDFLNERTLLRAFYRATGMMLRERYPAADTLVPMFVSRSPNLTSTAAINNVIYETVDADCMSYMAVQIKNHEKMQGLAKYREYLEFMSHDTILPSGSDQHIRVLLLIDVGIEPKPVTYRFILADNKTVGIVVRGIKPSSLVEKPDKDIDNYFETIRGVRYNLHDSADVQDMFKDSYRNF